MNERSINTGVSAMKKKQNKKDLKKHIQDTALNLFSKKGFDSVGMDELAKECKITKSLIYYYFKSKKDIMESIMKELEEDSVKMKGKYIEAIKSNPKTSIQDLLLPHTVQYISSRNGNKKYGYQECY